MAHKKLIDHNQCYHDKLPRSAISVGLSIGLHFAFFFSKAQRFLIGVENITMPIIDLCYVRDYAFEHSYSLNVGPS